MSEWSYTPVCDLGGGLELTYTSPDEDHRPRLHLGRWTPTKAHIRWTGWIDPAQLGRLYRFLQSHPEMMTDEGEPEDVDPADPFTP